METLEMAAPEAAEVIVLTPHQQEKYDEVMRWALSRGRHGSGDRRPPAQLKSKQALPAKLREVVGEFDDPDDYFVVEGYAGVGKSEMTAKLIVDLSAAGWDVAVAAPTNKAVTVIQTKVQQRAKNRVLNAEFGSVHHFSGLHLVETDDGDHQVSNSGLGKVYKYDILIVDEGSMVDKLYQLKAVAECRDNCIVLFVGDPCQLPPVREGAVSLVFSFPQKVLLTEVTRQALGNPLIAASIKVREKMAYNERVEVSDLMEWLPDCMVRGSRNIVPAAIDYQKKGWDARAVAWRNATVLSTNQEVHFDIYPGSSELFAVGERVIVQSACVAESLDTGESVDLATSEELVILDVERMKHPIYTMISCYQMAMQDALGQIVVVYVPVLMAAFKHRANELFQNLRDAKYDFERSGSGAAREKVSKTRGEAWGFKKAFAEIRHTYALTSHKSQGSTFDYAFVDVADLQMNPSSFEYNRSLYVAMTRPRHNAFFYY